MLGEPTCPLLSYQR